MQKKATERKKTVFSEGPKNKNKIGIPAEIRLKTITAGLRKSVCLAK